MKVQGDSGSSKTLSADAVNSEGEDKKEVSASSSPQEPEKSLTPVVKSTTEEPKKEGAEIAELSSSSLKAQEGDEGNLLEDSGKKTKDVADAEDRKDNGKKTKDVADAEDRRLSVDDKEDKESDMEVIEDSLATVKKNRKEKIFSSSTEEAQVSFSVNSQVAAAAAKMYTEIYPRVRNHVFHIPALSMKEDCRQLYQDSMISLTHWELMVSLYQASKLNTPVKDQSTLPNPFADSPEHLEDDMLHLTLMLGRGDVWMEETPQFHTRLRWLQAQLRLCSGKSEDAAIYMELLLSDLERLSDNGEEYVVQRTCVMDDQSVVCNSEVKRHLNLLQRSQMLEQVVDNYTDGRYRVVADLLIAIFHEPLPKARPGVTLPTRQTQLVILIDSLFKLNDQKGVITWGSHALTEALKRFNRAEAEEEKNRWAKTLMKITERSYTTITKNAGVVEEVAHENITQMVSTLTLMLVIQLEKPQSAEDLPFDTLTPWILLHRILTYEERRQEKISKTKDPKGVLDKKAEESARKETSSDKDSKEERTNDEQMEVDITGSEGSSEKSGQKSNESSKPLDASSEVQEESDKSEVAAETKIEGVNEESAKVEETSSTAKGPVGPYPSSLFLITAHDELGKHSWCCADDGVFLLYCLDVLIEELNRPIEGQHRQLLHHALEQVSFCLYSHPSKKSKHKHLRDHGVPQIALCWERALQLYHYYVPKELPTFQSSQIPSITDDVAALFKRIIALLPDEDKPENQTEAVEAYICGGNQECDFVPFKPSTDIVDCYYLLGDYYFKNKEWTNAIKYYKLDVSINVDRLDSWAPLGLAMKAMLETQLNSCEVIQDEEEFFSLAQQAVQCLKQALKLDEYHTNLWVEFGGLVYMVHSHASRLLKQDLNPDISLETFEMLEKLKGDMLKRQRDASLRP
nr:calcineurin-binding protein cabin-1-like [Penaeus vannamei]